MWFMPARSEGSRPLTATTERLVELLPGPVRDVVRRIQGDDVLILAAGLAFYALVSLAPFVILVLWVLSLLTSDAKVQELADQLARLAPNRLNLDEGFRRVAELGVRMGLGAFLALLWPATAYGAGIRRAFERLSPEARREARGLRGRALALALLGVMPPLALAGLVSSYLATTILGDGILALVGGWVLALVFGFIASWVTVAAIYLIFRPRPMPSSRLARGAATAAGSISVLSLGYVLFLNLATDFEQRYATSGLAAIVLLALWLFLANALILVGYEVAQEG
jgi:YihY family inner membrane protein